MSLASVSGWIATSLMIGAAVVPVAQRLLRGKRAELGSASVTMHFLIGLTAAGLGFLHPLTAVFALGSPEAVGGGVLALGFGGLAFVVLLAHTGLGLKLRDPKLKKRPSSRRAHVATAVTILLLVGAHVVACLTGGE